MKKLLMLVLLCVACNNNAGPPEKYFTPEKKIHYVKDSRTGLCFANGWSGGYNGGPFAATVPCSPEVEKLLQEELTTF